ncbi:MAG: hypothetical protein ACP5N7_00085 [Candidatus Pacearchaeota archaeon]
MRIAISEWFDKGIKLGATHMIVVCDTFSHDDYPVYVKPDEDVREIEKKYQYKNMQMVMEVYNLSDDKEKQMKQHRCFNY